MNFGAQNSVLVILLATTPKEDNHAQDELDDEVLLRQALRKSGFHVQQRIRIFLQPPDGAMATCDGWDWYVDGRLCYLYTSDAAALKGDTGATPPELKNDFRVNASLAKTKRLATIINLPNVSNMHQIVDREYQNFDMTENQGNMALSFTWH